MITFGQPLGDNILPSIYVEGSSASCSCSDLLNTNLASYNAPGTVGAALNGALKQSDWVGLFLALKDI